MIDRPVRLSQTAVANGATRALVFLSQRDQKVMQRVDFSVRFLLASLLAGELSLCSRWWSLIRVPAWERLDSKEIIFAIAGSAVILSEQLHWRRLVHTPPLLN